MRSGHRFWAYRTSARHPSVKAAGFESFKHKILVRCQTISVDICGGKAVIRLLNTCTNTKIGQKIKTHSTCSPRPEALEPSPFPISARNEGKYRQKPTFRVLKRPSKNCPFEPHRRFIYSGSICNLAPEFRFEVLDFGVQNFVLIEFFALYRKECFFVAQFFRFFTFGFFR